MRRDSRVKCANCVHSAPTKADQLLHCFLNPPTVLAVPVSIEMMDVQQDKKVLAPGQQPVKPMARIGVQLMAQWPPVNPDSYCGQFERDVFRGMVVEKEEDPA